MLQAKLRVGYGEAVCVVINLLCDGALVAQNFRVQPMVYPSDDYPEEAPKDNDEEVSGDIVDDGVTQTTHTNQWTMMKMMTISHTYIHTYVVCMYTSKNIHTYGKAASVFHILSDNPHKHTKTYTHTVAQAADDDEDDDYQHSRAEVKKEESKDTKVIESNIDPNAWMVEVEKVAPLLKMRMDADNKEVNFLKSQPPGLQTELFVANRCAV